MTIELYLGDSLNLIRTLSDSSIDLIMTDPPYGHNNNTDDLIACWESALARPHAAQSSHPRPIANDGAEANEIFRAILPEYKRVLKPGCCCCCCCCGGGGPDPQFARWSLWLNEVLQFKQMIIWDKGKIGMGWHYRRSYETVLIANKAGTCKWYDNTNKIENILRPGDYGIKKIIPQEDEHPTQKPVELAMLFIRLHTQVGDTVLDPFMGSGSFGLAAIMLGRNFIGFECDPHWFEVAQRRIAEAKAQPSLPNILIPEQAKMF